MRYFFDHWKVWTAPDSPPFTQIVAIGGDGISVIEQGNENKHVVCKKYADCTWQVAYQRLNIFAENQWGTSVRSRGDAKAGGLIPLQQITTNSFIPLIDHEALGIICPWDEFYVAAYWYSTNSDKNNTTCYYDVLFRPRQISRTDLMMAMIKSNCSRRCQKESVTPFPCTTGCHFEKEYDDDDNSEQIIDGGVKIKHKDMKEKQYPGGKTKDQMREAWEGDSKASCPKLEREVKRLRALANSLQKQLDDCKNDCIKNIFYEPPPSYVRWTEYFYSFQAHYRRCFLEDLIEDPVRSDIESFFQLFLRESKKIHDDLDGRKVPWREIYPEILKELSFKCIDLFEGAENVEDIFKNYRRNYFFQIVCGFFTLHLRAKKRGTVAWPHNELNVINGAHNEKKEVMNLYYYLYQTYTYLQMEKNNGNTADPPEATSPPMDTQGSTGSQEAGSGAKDTNGSIFRSLSEETGGSDKDEEMPELSQLPSSPPPNAEL